MTTSVKNKMGKDILRTIGNIRTDRRSIFGLAALGTAATVSAGALLNNEENSWNPGELDVSPAKEPRWSEAEWSEPSVSILADAMAKQPDDLLTVNRMGRMLQENLAGRRSTSIVSPLFSEQDVVGNQVRIKVVSAEKAVDFRGIEASVGKETGLGSMALFILKTSEDLPSHVQTGPSSLTFNKVILNNRFTQHDSDVALQLKVAKSLIYVWTHNEALNFLAKENKLYLPSEGPQRNAFLIHNAETHLEVDAKTKARYTSGIVANIWPDFAILPSYLNAKDQGMLSNSDLLGFADEQAYANHFMRLGALSKDKTGKYNWLGTQEQINRTWMVGALQVMSNDIPKEAVPHTRPRTKTYSA